MSNSKNTLKSARVREVLDRLFAGARQSEAKMREMFANISREERHRRMSDPNADYRGFYGQMKEHYLAVSPETARLLYLLGRSSNARAAIEFGTSFAVSTIHLAAAVRDNGGGKVIGTELEPSKAAIARANLEAAGLADLVEIREGDALESLSRDLPPQVDLVLLDGHKALYPRILELVEPHLRPGAVLVADNMDAAPAYAEKVRAAGGPYESVAFSDGVEVTVFTGT